MNSIKRREVPKAQDGWIYRWGRAPSKKIRGAVFRKLNTHSVLSWEAVTYVFSASIGSHTNIYQNMQERRINVAHDDLVSVRNDFLTNWMHNSLDLGVSETLQEISWWYWPPNWDWGCNWREGEFASRAEHPGKGKKIRQCDMLWRCHLRNPEDQCQWLYQIHFTF